MANYFTSENVYVFPTANRGTNINIEAQLNTERNMTKYAYLGKNYVISWDSDLLKCIIGGYYFEIKHTKPTAGDFWLTIKLVEKTLTTGQKTKVLALYDGAEGTLDVGTEFKGLAYDTTTLTGEYVLQVLSNGEIPAESKYYINLNNIQQNLKNLIDDGTGVKLNVTTSPFTISSVGNVVANDISPNSIKSIPVTDIFEAGSTAGTITATVKNATNATTATAATNVTANIGGKSLSTIFETNGTTVKNATKADKINTTVAIGNTNQLIYVQADGQILAGKKLFIQSLEPTDATEGDLWFVTQQ